MLMTTADELASSLRCAEFLADSPSTSTLLHHHVGAVTTMTNNLHHSEHRRRSGRVVLQPVNQRRLSHGQPTVVSRKRPSTVDVRLNTAQRPSVPSCLDRSIHRDERVLENLLIAEENLKSNHLYFTAVQEHIEPIHREQAVEWIFDVAKEEKCDADVFPLAVSLIDRFLSLQNIFRQDIQVLAGVCLFIASKVKAPQPMNAARVSYYTADSVKVHDILSWELLVLANLNWEITSPTGFDFFDHLSARLPSLHTLRPAFTSVLHRIQRCHKLATLFPSIQCCLALMFAAERYADAKLRADTESIIGSTFHLQMNLLRSYITMLERVVSDYGTCQRQQVASGEAELLAQSEGACGARSSSAPATPHNDSGFCSGSRVAMTRFFYYFAYGSNLLKDRIRVQIKGAEYECNGVLKNFKLEFVASPYSRWRGGIATIKETPGAEVHGCVWRVPHEFAAELDLQESGYHRLSVPVECTNATIECRTYQYSNITATSAAPSPHYKTVIVAGAIEHSLPEFYIKSLKEIPDNGYEGRVAVKVDAIKHLNQ
ncbi:Cyclin N-terminal domain-containing protein [Trichostrongylus colubriformis]|uniref:gamma-glutamylcyclotransferase n=1 Tax=Trichostrongylus colubriformis TaxID=6319 RepID=A0AAN8FRQ2_TRICO